MFCNLWAYAFAADPLKILKVLLYMASRRGLEMEREGYGRGRAREKERKRGSEKERGRSQRRHQGLQRVSGDALERLWIASGEALERLWRGTFGEALERLWRAPRKAQARLWRGSGEALGLGEALGRLWRGPGAKNDDTLMVWSSRVPKMTTV